MPGRWIYPIDPNCPVVERYWGNFYSDPMTDAVPSDVIGDISEAFEKRHRGECRHCQEYGVANVDVDY